jgi:hypothetical protein
MHAVSAIYDPGVYLTNREYREMYGSNLVVQTEVEKQSYTHVYIFGRWISWIMFKLVLNV